MGLLPRVPSLPLSSSLFFFPVCPPPPPAAVYLFFSISVNPPLSSLFRGWGWAELDRAAGRPPRPPPQASHPSSLSPAADREPDKTGRDGARLISTWGNSLLQAFRSHSWATPQSPWAPTHGSGCLPAQDPMPVCAGEPCAPCGMLSGNTMKYRYCKPKITNPSCCTRTR